MTHSLTARRTRDHAAEHDHGECPVGCDSTADDFREMAEQIERNAARRFAALDDDSRRAYAHAARTLAETQQAPEPEDDYGLGYAYRYGQISSALGALLDLVGLAPEE